MRLLINALVLLALAGCASKLPREQKILPPVELIQDCPMPAKTVATNRQLAEYTQALYWALRGCNDDKAALREWSEQ
jgi:hypothetical protein